MKEVTKCSLKKHNKIHQKDKCQLELEHIN